MDLVRVPSRAHKALIFWRALARRRWTNGTYTSKARPIVIGGCPRSGTTLLRVILDRHPRVCCGPESKLFLPDWPPIEELGFRYEIPRTEVLSLLAESNSQAEFIDRFFAERCRRAGKARWAEKSPLNVANIDFLFEHFPNARFIHVIRDGRDTVCSLRTFPSHKVVDGKRVPLDTRNPIARCARRWVRDVRAGLRHRADSRYTELRYEDLVAKPEATARSLFAFIGEEFDPCVLAEPSRSESPGGPLRDHGNSPEATRAIHKRAVSRWTTDLTAAELKTVERLAGDLLSELGYVGGGDGGAA
jgi:hypothetical protein